MGGVSSAASLASLRKRLATKKIAEAWVSEGTVSQWLKRVREGGVETLKAHPAPGPTDRLSQEQKAQLPALLESDAESDGFQGNLWTHQRLAWLIRQQFAVKYSSRQAGLILKQLGYSQQTSMQVAQQRSDAAIEQFLQEVIPELKKPV